MQERATNRLYPCQGRVTTEIYGLLDQKVKTSVNDQMALGAHVMTRGWTRRCRPARSEQHLFLLRCCRRRGGNQEDNSYQAIAFLALAIGTASTLRGGSCLFRPNHLPRALLLTGVPSKSAPQIEIVLALSQSIRLSAVLRSTNGKSESIAFNFRNAPLIPTYDLNLLSKDRSPMIAWPRSKSLQWR
jgi:hypothetical protein